MTVRLFATRDPADPALARLGAAAARHLRARRVSPGEPVVLVLGPGQEHDAVVLRIEGGGADCRVGAARPANLADPSRPTVLCVGLADPGRLDLVVEKSTELGATRVVVFRAKRSQLASVPASRLDRWRRIAISACEQCGRSWPPSIEAGGDVDDVAALVATAADAVVFTAPGGAPARAGDGGETPRGAPARPGAPVVFVVGPEGGLDDDEVRRLIAAGARAASLGPRVLRFETAAIAALARHAVDADGWSTGVPAKPLE
ncbi:MAG: RsmE family RNA methyltransferase [Alphaproteobacteria bacterium]